MAKHEEEKHEEKKPKHKLVSMHIHKADDGGHVIEHHYEDHKGHAMPPRFGGATSSMEDLHQHIDDHMGPESDAGASPEEGDQPEAGAATGDQGAAAPAMAGGGGAPEEQ
jgi:hypothetical protein